MRILIVFLLLFLCNNIDVCEGDNYEEVFGEMAKKEFRDALSNKTLEIWNWAREQSKSENTIIGRCLGIGKRLKMLIPLAALALGGILVTLNFLTIFSLKSVGIGVLLLIMNVAGWAGKLAIWKTQLTQHHALAPHPPQTVHFHLHKDNDHYSLDHSGPDSGWHDRISDGLSKTNSVMEKLELLNLYKRLGFNVDNFSSYR